MQEPSQLLNISSLGQNFLLQFLEMTLAQSQGKNQLLAQGFQATPAVPITPTIDTQQPAQIVPIAKVIKKPVKVIQGEGANVEATIIPKKLSEGVIKSVNVTEQPQVESEKQMTSKRSDSKKQIAIKRVGLKDKLNNKTEDQNRNSAKAEDKSNEPTAVKVNDSKTPFMLVKKEQTRSEEYEKESNPKEIIFMPEDEFVSTLNKDKPVSQPNLESLHKNPIKNIEASPQNVKVHLISSPPNDKKNTSLSVMFPSKNDEFKVPDPIKKRKRFRRRSQEKARKDILEQCSDDQINLDNSDLLDDSFTFLQPLTEEQKAEKRPEVMKYLKNMIKGNASKDSSNSKNKKNFLNYLTFEQAIEFCLDYPTTTNPKLIEKYDLTRHVLFTLKEIFKPIKDLSFIQKQIQGTSRKNKEKDKEFEGQFHLKRAHDFEESRYYSKTAKQSYAQKKEEEQSMIGLIDDQIEIWTSKVQKQQGPAFQRAMELYNIVVESSKSRHTRLQPMELMIDLVQTKFNQYEREKQQNKTEHQSQPLSQNSSQRHEQNQMIKKENGLQNEKNYYNSPQMSKASKSDLKTQNVQVQQYSNKSNHNSHSSKNRNHNNHSSQNSNHNSRSHSHSHKNNNNIAIEVINSEEEKSIYVNPFRDGLEVIEEVIPKQPYLQQDYQQQEYDYQTLGEPQNQYEESKVIAVDKDDNNKSLKSQENSTEQQRRQQQQQIDNSFQLYQLEEDGDEDDDDENNNNLKNDEDEENKNQSIMELEQHNSNNNSQFSRQSFTSNTIRTGLVPNPDLLSNYQKSNADSYDINTRSDNIFDSFINSNNNNNDAEREPQRRKKIKLSEDEQESPSWNGNQDKSLNVAEIEEIFS